MMCYVFFNVCVTDVFSNIRIKVTHANPFFLAVWSTLLSTELYVHNKPNNHPLLAISIFHFDSHSKASGQIPGNRVIRKI